MDTTNLSQKDRNITLRRWAKHTVKCYYNDKDLKINTSNRTEMLGTMILWELEIKDTGAQDD